MVSGGYGTPSAKISLETITSVSQYFCRLSTPATMLSNADPAPAPSGANSSFASRLPKSSSKIPSYCRESLRFAKSSVLSTVAKPFPARSARCRAIRASADLPNGCMVARYNRLCAFSHTSRSACSDLPEAAPPVTKISIFAPLSELDLQSALIFDTIILSE